MHELAKLLQGIDGRGYKAYKELQRKSFQFDGFLLLIDHVQGDPYAAPSRLRAVVSLDDASLPRWALGTPVRRRATRDFLIRQFQRSARAEPERHCATVEDQVALRSALADLGLVAFVVNNAVLPRRSGVDDRPLIGAVPFTSPPSLEVTLMTPNAGPVTGMGIPRGISLIVGGGFHGKSTLLRALEKGVWDHIPGDGREGVVCDPTAIKIRSEDGRSVCGVDISPFIDNRSEIRLSIWRGS